MNNRKHRIVSSADAGMPVGKYLKTRLNFSQAQIRSLKFCENGICVNGVRARVTQLLQDGDILELCLKDPSRSSGHLEAAGHPLEILYEDADLIAVWKRAGMIVHPAHGHYRDTMANYLRAYFLEKQEDAQICSIGRLDRDTSGVMVFAKNRIAAARLWEQREKGIFVKEYLALAEGSYPREDFLRMRTIDAPIGPVPSEKNKMCVTPSGKRAVTHFQAVDMSREDIERIFEPEADLEKSGEEIFVPEADLEKGGEEIFVPEADLEKAGGKIFALEADLEKGGERAFAPEAGLGKTRQKAEQKTENITVLRLRLETGRTHQIRVHMAYTGHPLVGDSLYGNGEEGQYARLCAWKAVLLQPFTGREIEIRGKNIMEYE